MKTSPYSSRGFSLLELLVAISIAGLIIGTSVPYAQKMYQSMQYRSAVKDTLVMMMTARYLAGSESRSVDLFVYPKERKLRVGKEERLLPDSIDVSAVTAAEVNDSSEGAAVIRFYSDGSSTGGTVNLKGQAKAVRLKVDWFMGKVSQESYEA